LRNSLARPNEPVHAQSGQALTSPAAVKTHAKKTAKIQRQQLASERLHEKIRLTKLQRAEKALNGKVPPMQKTILKDASIALPALAPMTLNAELPLKPAASRVKRLFDFFGAVAMLIALSPVMIMLACLVRRDGGPAIFGHRRIGSNGETFHCLKFRSMCVDAERRLQEHLANNAEAQAEWARDFKLRDDPRITQLGQFLRRTSLDELPQLINVIRGEMSLVGPRPIVADEVERYGNRFTAYLNCRPGITGLWQVSGRNDVSYSARVRLDSFYATRWSLMKDVFILVRTVSVVFRRSGAY